MFTKTDLAESIRQTTGCPIRKAVEAADNIIADLISALRYGDGEVRLTGFASLRVIETPARQGRNPLTGSQVTIKAQRKVRFRMGKELRMVLNDGVGV